RRRKDERRKYRPSSFVFRLSSHQDCPDGVVGWKARHSIVQSSVGQQSWGGRRRARQPGAARGGLGRAVRYLGRQRRTAALAYGALVVATIAQLAVPQLVQNMIDAVQNGAIAHLILGKVPPPLQAAAAH